MNIFRFFCMLFFLCIFLEFVLFNTASGCAICMSVKLSTPRGPRGPKAREWACKPKDPGKGRSPNPSPKVSGSPSMDSLGPIGHKPGTKHLKAPALALQKDMMLA